jgi:hypothetical protein
MLAFKSILSSLGLINRLFCYLESRSLFFWQRRKALESADWVPAVPRYQTRSTLGHLFLSCPLAIASWSFIGLQVDTSLQSAIEILLSKISSPRTWAPVRGPQLISNRTTPMDLPTRKQWRPRVSYESATCTPPFQ